MTALGRSMSATASTRVRAAWAAGRAADASRVIADLLDSGQLKIAVDVIVADAEERWDRGLPATVEVYEAELPALRGDRAVGRALLMCEATRRTSEEPRLVRADLLARVPHLSEEVEAVCEMLDLMRGAGSDAAQSATVPVESPVPGQRLGKYELIERLGAGSFGEVWRALDRQLERYVALKLLHAGGASSSSSDIGARFIAEARAAAALDHEHVVAVHDAGRFDENGRFYIDSQLAGDPAPTPTDSRHVSVGRSLESMCEGSMTIPWRAAAHLIAQVAHGVAAAHARGILHRDIKPANIIVTPSGRPLVADFGLSVSGMPTAASASDPGPHASGPSATVMLETPSGGRVIGTPAFMAPEQARGERVGPLTDVYALGATLRFVLTGRPPVQPTGRHNKDPRWDVIAQVAGGSVPPLAPTTGIPAEIIAVCNRAMAFDAASRYSSAAQFADDLHAILDHRPCAALPPSLSRRLWLVARRNRAATLIGLTAALLLTITAISAITRIIHERDRAVAAETEAGKQRDAANLARDTAEAINRFTADTVGTAIAARGSSASKMIDVIKIADQRVRTALADKPLLEAGARHMLGQVMISNLNPVLAREHLERALAIRTQLLGPEAPDTLRTRRLLLATRDSRGHEAELEADYRAMLAVCQRVLGPDDADTYIVMSRLASVLRLNGDPAAARALQEDAVAGLRRIAGISHPEYLGAAGILALARSQARQYDSAIELQQSVVDGYEQVFGADDVTTASARRAMATMLRSALRSDEAVTALRAASAQMTRAAGPESANAVTTDLLLAETLLFDLSDAAAALPIAETVEPRALALGQKWIVPTKAKLVRGACLFALGREDEGGTLIQAAYDAFMLRTDVSRQDVNLAARLLRDVYRSRGDDEGLERLLARHPVGPAPDAGAADKSPK